MRVLGIDPGYDRLGVAFLEKKHTKETVLYSTCLESEKKESIPDRIHSLGTTLESFIQKHTPQHLAIEKTFFSKNKKTAIAVSEARGAIMYICSKHGLELFEYSPQAIKLAVTGYGKSDKQQVMSMLPKLVHLEERPRLDDEFDAIGVALTHLATM